MLFPIPYLLLLFNGMLLIHI